MSLNKNTLYLLIVFVLSITASILILKDILKRSDFTSDTSKILYLDNVRDVCIEQKSIQICIPVNKNISLKVIKNKQNRDVEIK
jgi:hypothetical protein